MKKKNTDNKEFRSHKGNKLSAAEKLSLEARELAATEQHDDRPSRGFLDVGLLWPGSYEAGMASLGYLWAMKVLSIPEVTTVHRYFGEPPCWSEGAPALALESRYPLYQMDIVAISVSYEPDILVMLKMLRDAGISEFSNRRDEDDPIVIVGGPLVRANPSLVVPFGDICIAGDGDGFGGVFGELLRGMGNSYGGKAALMEGLKASPGYVAPELADGITGLGKVLHESVRLPVVSSVIAPRSALGSLRLVEVTRGCPKQCTFCIGRGSNLSLRQADPALVMSLIPEGTPGLGLVGAAVSYWSGLEGVLEQARARGMGIGISSLRADRLSGELVGLLASCGTKILTVAADGASERMRKKVKKGVSEQHLIDAAGYAKDAGMSAMKVYQMIGLPGEKEADYEEMAEFCTELSSIIQVVLSASVFVPKRFTPLQGADFAGTKYMDSVVRYIRGMLGPGVSMSQVSPREAAMEYLLNRATTADAEAIVELSRTPARFSDYRSAFADRFQLIND